jgi:hypothetical protein
MAAGKLKRQIRQVSRLKERIFMDEEIIAQMEETIRNEAQMLIQALQERFRQGSGVDIFQDANEVQWDWNSCYVTVARLQERQLPVQVWYDATLDDEKLGFWVGLGDENRERIKTLVNDCADAFADYHKVESYGALRRIHLEDVLSLPVAEFCPGPYNGFGIYGKPGAANLDVPRAINFVVSVLCCLPDYLDTEGADARRSAISVMANHAEQTARSAKGQIVLRNVEVKTKELRMTRADLESHMEELLNQRENKCALTGIEFQFVGNNKNLFPSLDRIDSEGHYEKPNLQIVCRFINFWKCDMPNQEFQSLLKLVRESRPVESSS